MTDADELPWDATPFLPPDDDLDSLRKAAANCRM
jgi:hypothetical protein